MKKLILTLVLVMATMAASANSVRYFTRPQAKRVAAALDAQNELMIYCGYEYELATYVIVNEVWIEPVNSKYYEIWLYGFDAYTGEEIYMPIDLACIWLYNHYGNRMYSAAQYLRFRSTVATPNFYWTMPPYNSFTRRFHDPMFNHGYTYHYEIHRFGWRPPAPPHGGPWPYHPYYMRTPHTPAPVPTHPFTPGLNYPITPDGHGYIPGNNRNTVVGTRNTSVTSSNGGARSGNGMNNAGNPGTTNRNNTTNTGSTNNRGTATNTGATNDRGTSTNTGTTNNRGTVTNTGATNDRGTSTNTGTTNNRGTSTNTGATNSRGTATNAGTTNNRGTSTNTGTTTNRGTSTNTGTTTNRGTSTNTGTTTNRGTSTNTGTTTNRGTSTNSGSTSNRGNNTNTGSRPTR